ncbi:MaoC family dehydratase [Methyloligella sp. 2.7D]|uniref:MaoC family dehydratase n=1 Tax=unclassified Methyloligella TaxID=2625955 RepID=UPI00157C47C0|nr:MaoC family dehydratase [Methyloligella sp. GL2]QKP76712.1 MaoC family dehydratase [Methyloligella sp. GL2]
MNEQGAEAPGLLQGHYLEDLSVGQVFETGRYEMTPEAIKAFASKFDPQPFHTDEAAAEKSFFGGLVASGWHTGSATMRMLVDSGFLADGFIGGGAEVTWPRATKPGDILRVRGEVLEIKPSRSKPDRGMVTAEVTTLNQRDEVVQRMVTTLVVHRRPA